MTLGFDGRMNLYDEYRDKWVVIFPQRIQGTFSGYCVDIREVYAVLDPFNGKRLKDGKLENALIEGRSIVPLMGSVVEPTTKEDIIAFLESLNNVARTQSS